MSAQPDPLNLRERLGYRVRVAGLADDLTGSVGKAVEAAGTGIGDAARTAGSGIGDAASGVGDAARSVGSGIGEGARSAGGGISDAAQTVGGGVSNAAGSVGDAATSAASAAKWGLALLVGAPLVAGAAMLAALAYSGRKAAQALGPDALPALLPLLGPEGLAAATVLGGLSRPSPNVRAGAVGALNEQR
jgi:hypothetical protein